MFTLYPSLLFERPEDFVNFRVWNAGRLAKFTRRRRSNLEQRGIGSDFVVREPEFLKRTSNPICYRQASTLLDANTSWSPGPPNIRFNNRRWLTRSRALRLTRFAKQTWVDHPRPTRVDHTLS